MRAPLSPPRRSRPLRSARFRTWCEMNWSAERRQRCPTPANTAPASPEVPGHTPGAVADGADDLLARLRIEQPLGRPHNADRARDRAGPVDDRCRHAGIADRCLLVFDRVTLLADLGK